MNDEYVVFCGINDPAEQVGVKFEAHLPYPCPTKIVGKGTLGGKPCSYQGLISLSQEESSVLLRGFLEGKSFYASFLGTKDSHFDEWFYLQGPSILLPGSSPHEDLETAIYSRLHREMPALKGILYAHAFYHPPNP